MFVQGIEASDRIGTKGGFESIQWVLEPRDQIKSMQKFKFQKSVFRVAEGHPRPFFDLIPIHLLRRVPGFSERSLKDSERRPGTGSPAIPVFVLHGTGSTVHHRSPPSPIPPPPGLVATSIAPPPSRGRAYGEGSRGRGREG